MYSRLKVGSEKDNEIWGWGKEYIDSFQCVFQMVKRQMSIIIHLILFFNNLFFNKNKT